ncbi:MAG: OmpA family protein [Acidobacteria bacterium]|nr:OmpA family protein [Acidobacteriota bacterium]
MRSPGLEKAERRLTVAAWITVFLALAAPLNLLAVDWPWKKKPDEVTSECRIAPAEVEQGFQGRLRASVEASDSRGHPLAYVWSANGGVLEGTGPEVELDAGKLNPGVYSVLALVQDAYQHVSQCRADFRVVRPVNALTIACSAEPAVVEPGVAAEIQAKATDRLGRSLRYRWFSNGGEVRGEGPAVRLDTTGLSPGLYTVTGRVEDGWGGASDCITTVKVEIPPPPPVPPEPVNVAQIVFPPNRQGLEPQAESQLDAVLRRLLAEPEGRISIEAYAGPDERDPQRLAGDRAETVKQYLLEHGAPQSRIQTVIGLGGRRGGARNRTLDIIWLPDGVEY